MIQGQQTLQRLEEILPQLPLPQLEMVLTFTEFVRERVLLHSEDEVLWSFVERERAYRAAHPDDVSFYDTDEALLAALEATA